MTQRETLSHDHICALLWLQNERGRERAQESGKGNMGAEREGGSLERGINKGEEGGSAVCMSSACVNLPH